VPGEVFKLNFYPVKNSIDPQNGILKFAALVELPFTDGFNGTGTLLKMKFKAVKAGKTSLSLVSNVLEPVKEGDKITGKTRGALNIEVTGPAGQGVSGGNTADTGGSGGGGSAPPDTGQRGQSNQDAVPPANNETGKDSTGQVSFSDLPTVHWAFHDINFLAGKGLVKGYNDGSFKPQQNISRQEFAVLVERIAEMNGNNITGYALPYKDAGQIAGWARQAVAAATFLGIFQGDAEGKFNPHEFISRAEITVVLIRVLGKEKEVVSLLQASPFTDVENHWAKGYIALAKNLQLVNGYADGSFKPQGKASRAEVCAMLVRLLKKKV
jgi:hypothetical protein